MNNKLKLKTNICCEEGKKHILFENIGKKVDRGIKKIGEKINQGLSKAGDKIQDGLVHTGKRMREFRKSRKTVMVLEKS